MVGKPFLILVIAPVDVGDAIAVSGLIPRLLREIPEAQFTIVAGPETAPLFEYAPNLTRIVVAAKYEGFGAQVSLRQKLSGKTWGLVLDLGHAGIATWLKRKRRAELPEDRMDTNRTVAAAHLLGFDADPPTPFLYTSPEIESATDEALIGEGPIIAVGPGAGWVGRMWPAERYGQVASKLMMTPGAPLAHARILALGGDTDRDAMQESVFPLPRKRIISRPYSQDLMTDYAWLKRCRLYIGGDNVWTQLAAAAGVPTVAIFGPSDDRVYAPFGPHVTVVRGPRDFATLKALDPEFSYQVSHLNDLTVDTVLTAAQDLLSRTGPADA